MQTNEPPSDRTAVDEPACPGGLAFTDVSAIPDGPDCTEEPTGTGGNDPFEGATVILPNSSAAAESLPQPVPQQELPAEAPAPARVGLWRRSVRTSALVHGLLLAALVLIPYRWWAGTRVAAVVPPPESPRAAPKEIKQEKHPDGAPKLAPSRVQERFSQILEEQQKLSPAELEARLRKAAAGLDQVTDAESVNRIGQEFGQWFGTKERAAAPQAAQAKAKAIDFDHNTAQIHDVKRRTEANGKIRYTAVLLDAAGRTLEVPLPADDGERLFGIFEMMKQNPLLDQVYRQLAMPLLDRLLNEKRE